MFTILTASPRKDGFTNECATVIMAAMSKYFEVKIVNLYDKRFTNCVACGKRGWGTCHDFAQCREDKGFNDLQADLEHGNGFAICSPVYFAEPSEICKLFLDKLRRCQYHNKKTNFTNLPALFLAAAGGGNGAKDAIKTFQNFANYIKIDPIAYLDVTPKNRETVLSGIPKIIDEYMSTQTTGSDKDK
jgi:multimeric flavodoxin WrbA